MSRLLLLPLFFISASVFAQPSGFGQVSEEDFAASLPGEEDAPAVVIFDIGEAKFRLDNNAFRVHFTQTVRIKINSKEALHLGEVIVPLMTEGYNRTETLEDVQGYTYIKEDGEIRRIPMGVDQVFDEQLTNDVKVKKLVLPAVRENSIIEYTYRRVRPFISLPDWNFQWSVPVLYSSYQVALNPFYEYSFRLQGASRFDYQTSELEGGVPRRAGAIEYHDMIHKYVMKNIPSFRDEAFITSREDYIMKLDFQLAKINRPSGASEEYMTTWEDMNEELLKHEDFGKFLKQSDKYSRELVNKIPPGEDKVRWLVEYIRENYTWDGYFHKLTYQKAKEFADSRKGGSAEINLFLCSALREAGVDAKPVLISTRNHGQIHTNYPFESQFNNVIVLVNTDQGLILTDGTEQYIPYNTIPPLCINGKGLVVDKDDGQFVNLQGYDQSQISINLSMEIDPQKNTINGGVLCQGQGYGAYELRKLVENTKEYEENADQYGIRGIYDFETDPGERSKFTMRYKGHGELRRLGENIIVSPFLNWTILSDLDENLLVSRERKYPVDMIYANRTIFSSQMKIPDGYRMEDFPSPYSKEDDLVKIEYSCKKLGDHIVTQGEATFKKSVYSPREYRRLRGHYIKMTELFGTELILVRENIVSAGE